MATLGWVAVFFLVVVIIFIIILVSIFHSSPDQQLQPTQGVTFPREQLDTLYAPILSPIRLDNRQTVTPGMLTLTTGQVIRLNNFQAPTVFAGISSACPNSPAGMRNAVSSLTGSNWVVTVVGVDQAGFQTIMLQEQVLAATDQANSFLRQCLPPGCCGVSSDFAQGNANVVVGGGRANDIWTVIQVSNVNAMRLRNTATNAFLALCFDTTCSTTDAVDPGSNIYATTRRVGCSTAWLLSLVNGPSLQSPATPEEIAEIERVATVDDLRRPGGEIFLRGRNLQ